MGDFFKKLFWYFKILKRVYFAIVILGGLTLYFNKGLREKFIVFMTKYSPMVQLLTQMRGPQVGSDLTQNPAINQDPALDNNETSQEAPKLDLKVVAEEMLKQQQELAQRKSLETQRALQEQLKAQVQQNSNSQNYDRESGQPFEEVVTNDRGQKVVARLNTQTGFYDLNGRPYVYFKSAYRPYNPKNVYLVEGIYYNFTPKVRNQMANISYKNPQDINAAMDSQRLPNSQEGPTDSNSAASTIMRLQNNLEKAKTGMQERNKALEELYKE
jgi:hypothetical protein